MSLNLLDAESFSHLYKGSGQKLFLLLSAVVLVFVGDQSAHVQIVEAHHFG